jgi:hypothetical protein
LQARWLAILAEGEAEAAHQTANSAAAARSYTETLRNGGPQKNARDPVMKTALLTLKDRLDRIWPALNDGDEAAFNDRLDDLEASLKAATASLGIARRESRLRMSAAAAAASVERAVAA